MLIAIEGNIGSGKTTTAQLIAQTRGWPVVLEDLGLQPYLEMFYRNPALYGLETELAFLVLHYHQTAHLPGQSTTVTDFSPRKDVIFGQTHLAHDKLRQIEVLFSLLFPPQRLPDLVFFLDVPSVELVTRIR